MVRYISNMAFTNRKGFVDSNDIVKFWVYDNFKEYGNVLISEKDYKTMMSNLWKTLNENKKLKFKNSNMSIDVLFKKLGIKKKDSIISKKRKIIDLYLKDLFECDVLNIRELKAREILDEADCIILERGD